MNSLRYRGRDFCITFVPNDSCINEIEAEKFLNKCGDSRKLVNRKVEVNRTGCIPAGLTRIITLGVWQWCPATVSWEADVKQTKTQSKLRWSIPKLEFLANFVIFKWRKLL